VKEDDERLTHNDFDGGRHTSTNATSLSQLLPENTWTVQLAKLLRSSVHESLGNHHFDELHVLTHREPM